MDAVEWMGAVEISGFRDDRRMHMHMVLYRPPSFARLYRITLSCRRCVWEAVWPVRVDRDCGLDIRALA
jgi:hypothetical protein